jgi:hypothetical protein
MREKGVEHVSADSRASLVRDLVEMQEIRKLFREREGGGGDTLFDSHKVLARTAQIGLRRR